LDNLRLNHSRTAARLPKASLPAPAHWIAALVLAAAVVLLTNCATNHSALRPPPIGHGAEEYQQITTQAVTVVLGALPVLDRVGAETNRCSPETVAAFSREVEQLQVDSFKVRSRSKAILARGDAYFETWSQNPSFESSPHGRKVARELPQLRQAFDKIKLASQQAGEAFRPFLSGLRKLRVELETDPGVVQKPETKELVATTRKHGSEVVQALNDISSELQAVMPVIDRARVESNL
jgi:hypothetical protein